MRRMGYLQKALKKGSEGSDELKSRITFLIKGHITALKERFAKISDINISMNSIMREKKHAFSLAVQSLDQLSPLEILRRGFSVATDEKKEIIRSIEQVEQDEKIDIYFTDGKAECTVIDVKKGVCFGKE